jgi:hypothetical protein
MTNRFTVVDADRLLGFADQFIEDMENDENDDIDSDERESIDEYRRIRPLMVAAPRLLDVLQSVEVLIWLELKAEPGTSLHRALQDIQAAIAEAQPVTSKKQQLADRIMALLPSSAVNPVPLAQAIIGEVTQFFYDPDRAIATVWTAEDIQRIRPALNDGQVLQVLRYIDKHHDSNSGICWNSLEFWADDLFPIAEPAAGQ